MNEVLSNTQLDPARILTEAAIFADKVAVDEETVRLRSHIEQLREMLDKGGAIGRKLDFLIQEFNREANTIGSKCSDIDIARQVVDISLISAQRLLAVIAPESAPIKRMIQEARERGVLIDATYGRKTCSVLVMDNDHLILSALSPDVVASRLEGEKADRQEEEGATWP